MIATTLLAALGGLGATARGGDLDEFFKKVTGTDKAEVKDGDAEMNLPEYRGIKHAVGVRDFDNDANWTGRWKLTHNLTVMFESALYDTGYFVIVERQKVGAVLADQDLARSGRGAEASTVAQTGKLRPAKYIGTGSLVEVEHRESGGDGAIRIKGFKIGADKQKAQITIIAKLIDSSTGELVAKKRIVGRAGRAKVRVGYSESRWTRTKAA